jgi:hypothetical protein
VPKTTVPVGTSDTASRTKATISRRPISLKERPRRSKKTTQTGVHSTNPVDAIERYNLRMLPW